MFPQPDFTPEAIAVAQAHAVAAFPKESCGLIVDGHYVPCDNIADDPEKYFVIAPKIFVETKGTLQAVLHSHPDAQGIPTKEDMQGQIDTGVIWGIIPCNRNEAFKPVFWGDFLLDMPLIGREFIHGVSDCGALIRAWFWQVKGVKIPEFARDDAWWTKGEDLYCSKFTSAGFRRIDVKDARSGDVFLGQVRSSVPNHGGIYLDNGLVLHHLAGRLSRREPLGQWQKFVTHWLRFDGLPQG